jgi:hypothetical protein
VSVLEPRRRPPKRPTRRESLGRALLLAVVGGLAFLLGIAFARTLDERPRSGGVVTDVRTLTPLQQQPPARTVTVTETVTGP